MKLDAAPWTRAKAARKALKHAAWLAIAVATGGAWVFYFDDAPTLLRQLLTFSAPPAAYASIALLTATTFTFGGFMREQVCIYMCPWPRIQGAMMDDQTLTVAYREWRGGTSPLIPLPGVPSNVGGPIPEKETLGDCIDCNACVNVCPMGIDIRDGQQLACITCALCIDACDEVMDKVGYPRGLIRYDTQHGLERQAKRILRPRTIVYGALLAVLVAGFAVALANRNVVGVDVIRDRNALYRERPDGRVENVYNVKILNKDHVAHDFTIKGSGLPDLEVHHAGPTVRVAPGAVHSVPVKVRVPRDAVHGGADLVFTIEAVDQPGLASSGKARFIAPVG
jgi:cytochrome c oxidase accessory protein FixG